MKDIHIYVEADKNGDLVEPFTFNNTRCINTGVYTLSDGTKLWVLNASNNNRRYCVVDTSGNYFNKFVIDNFMPTIETKMSYTATFDDLPMATNIATICNVVNPVGKWAVRTI